MTFSLSRIGRALLVLSLAVCLSSAWGGSALAEQEPAAPPEEVENWDSRVGDAIAGTGNVLNKGWAGGLDLIVIRPMGAVATACGFGFFVLSLPLSAPTMSFKESWGIFVEEPALYTFDRPLGRF